ncbi:unnamed protein product, partial [Durusdinium trenchii]
RATWPKTAAIFGSCSENKENYTTVQALQIMKGGQLLVLHSGSSLDAWDLPEGNLLGRFHLSDQSAASAFCILEDGPKPRLLVARSPPTPQGQGPTLEMVSLPSLRPASCKDSSDGSDGHMDKPVGEEHSSAIFA